MHALQLDGLYGIWISREFSLYPKNEFHFWCPKSSKNFRVKIDYNMNLILQHCLLWLELKREFDPPAELGQKKALEEKINEMRKLLLEGSEGEDEKRDPIVKIGIGCRNVDGSNCKKMEMSCVAIENGKIDFKKCPILMNEIKKVTMSFNVSE
jgi:hypothetical protein